MNQKISSVKDAQRSNAKNALFVLWTNPSFVKAFFFIFRWTPGIWDGACVVEQDWKPFQSQNNEYKWYDKQNQHTLFLIGPKEHYGIVEKPEDNKQQIHRNKRWELIVWKCTYQYSKQKDTMKCFWIEFTLSHMSMGGSKTQIIVGICIVLFQ